MMPKTKNIVYMPHLGKGQRTATSLATPIGLQFTDRARVERYNRVKTHRFRETRYTPTLGSHRSLELGDDL